MKKIEILLADDHSVVRTGLKAIFSLEKDFKVVGQAENGRDAARLAGELKPDIVVMDLMMPGMTCAEAVRLTIAASPDTKVLILTSYGTSDELRFALDAGASGAITKNMSDDEIAVAIRKVVAGEKVLAPEIKGSLEESKRQIVLSERQHLIVESITRGLSNQEIADLLGISRTRVKQHLNEVFDVLGASNRAEVAAIAISKHLLKI